MAFRGARNRREDGERRETGAGEPSSFHRNPTLETSRGDHPSTPLAGTGTGGRRAARSRAPPPAPGTERLAATAHAGPRRAQEAGRLVGASAGRRGRGAGRGPDPEGGGQPGRPGGGAEGAGAARCPPLLAPSRPPHLVKSPFVWAERRRRRAAEEEPPWLRRARPPARAEQHRLPPPPGLHLSAPPPRGRSGLVAGVPARRGRPPLPPPRRPAGTWSGSSCRPWSWTGWPPAPHSCARRRSEEKRGPQRRGAAPALPRRPPARPPPMGLSSGRRRRRCRRQSPDETSPRQRRLRRVTDEGRGRAPRVMRQSANRRATTGAVGAGRGAREGGARRGAGRPACVPGSVCARGARVPAGGPRGPGASERASPAGSTWPWLRVPAALWRPLLASEPCAAAAGTLAPQTLR